MMLCSFLSSCSKWIISLVLIVQVPDEGRLTVTYVDSWNLLLLPQFLQITKFWSRPQYTLKKLKLFYLFFIYKLLLDYSMNILHIPKLDKVTYLVCTRQVHR